MIIHKQPDGALKAITSKEIFGVEADGPTLSVEYKDTRVVELICANDVEAEKLFKELVESWQKESGENTSEHDKKYCFKEPQYDPELDGKGRRSARPSDFANIQGFSDA